MDIFIAEADNCPALGAWSSFELAVESLVKRFGVDPADFHELEREPGVWSAPTDMNMGCCYISKHELDTPRHIAYVDD